MACDSVAGFYNVSNSSESSVNDLFHFNASSNLYSVSVILFVKELFVALVVFQTLPCNQNYSLAWHKTNVFETSVDFLSS